MRAFFTARPGTLDALIVRMERNMNPGDIDIESKPSRLDSTGRDRRVVLSAMLVRERADAISRLEVFRREEAEDAALPPGDEVDTARAIYETETQARLIERAYARLRDIEAAIGRLGRGSYGICADCGEEIPMARLAAAPCAVRCVDCQQRANRGTRQGRGRDAAAPSSRLARDGSRSAKKAGRPIRSARYWRQAKAFRFISPVPSIPKRVTARKPPQIRASAAARERFAATTAIPDAECRRPARYGRINRSSGSLYWPPRSSSMTTAIKRILCAIDHGEASLAALDLAVDIAVQHGAKLLLLNVAPLPLGESATAPIPLEPMPFQEEAHRKEMEKIARERIGDKAPYEITIVAGDPSVEIVREARRLGADLIAIGTHGRKGLGHLVLGSVAEWVVRESPVPVLTVRATPSGPPTDT
ncbi:MAG: universal stress protein [Candidatus Binataceae bacterium]